MSLPTDDAARKGIPIYSGVLMYFPDAVAAVAELSRIGNDQHNPGEPMHWARGKSTNQLDTLTRHLMEAGKIDTDGVRHSTKAAWRALANLQLEIEAAQAESVEGVLEDLRNELAAPVPSTNLFGNDADEAARRGN